MQTDIKMGFKCVYFLDCVVIHCEVIRIIAMSSNFHNTLYISDQMVIEPFDFNFGSLGPSVAKIHVLNVYLYNIALATI